MKADSRKPAEQPSTEPGTVEQEAHTCPVCGTKFLATTGREFCPVCILRGATSGESAATGKAGSGSESAGSLGDTEGTPQVRRFENYEVMLGDDGRPIELGRGAMGVTYKALDVDLRCPVTLKVISERYLGDESARLRFLREARAAAWAALEGLVTPKGLADSAALLARKQAWAEAYRRTPHGRPVESAAESARAQADDVMEGNDVAEKL